MHTFKLPSGKEIEIREMSGLEEKLLRDRKLVTKGIAFDRVMSACTKRIDDNCEVSEKDILNLISIDRSYLLLELRKLTYGSEIEVEQNCRECGELVRETFDLGDITMIPPILSSDYKLKLPVSGHEIAYAQMNGHHEREIAQLKNPNDNDAMLKCIVAFNGDAFNRDAILSLSGRDLLFLRNAMKGSFGRLEDKAQLTCDCGNVVNVNLLREPSFLYPGM